MWYVPSRSLVLFLRSLKFLDLILRLDPCMSFAWFAEKDILEFSANQAGLEQTILNGE